MPSRATERTILIDTREHLPFAFPRIVTVGGRGRVLTARREGLKAGDYALAGSRACIVERKYNVQELGHNLLTADRARQLKAFDKLTAACRHPVLMVEQTASGILTPPQGADPSYCGAAIDALLAELLPRGILLWLIGRCVTPGARIHAGELVARLLIGADEQPAAAPKFSLDDPPVAP